MIDTILELKLQQGLIQKLEEEKKYFIELLDQKYVELETAKSQIKDLETIIEKLMYRV